MIRWKTAKLAEDDFADESYIGVMGHCVWQLRQTNNHLLYRILGELKTEETDKYYNHVRIKVPVPKTKKLKLLNSTDDSQHLFNTEYYELLLHKYFRLDIDLNKCYQEWIAAHKHFESQSNKFYAIRVLNQDPIENLFSFICSQNNHISR